MSVGVEHRWPASLRLERLEETVEDLRATWPETGASAWRNAEGGDVGCGGRKAMLRHTANYLMAAGLATFTRVQGQVVDVGCGTGLHSRWLAQRLGRPLWAVDRDPAVLRHLRARPDVQRCFLSLAEVPDRSAAVVTAMEVIEHVAPSAQHEFLAHIERIAAPGATVVVSTPDESIYRGGHSGYAPHIGTLDACALREAMRSAGLTPTVWRLSGGPFDTSRIERFALPTGNRVVARIRRAAPVPVAIASVGIAAVIRRYQGAWSLPSPDDAVVIARQSCAVRGSGLVAAAVIGRAG